MDPIHGKRGKQRSVNNTYFTLPVLFAMLSGHYSFTYTHPQNWLVLVAMMFAGAAIRQFFVLRHGFKLGRNSHPWPYALAGVLALVVLVVWLRPAPAVVPVATNSIVATPVNTGATSQIGYKTVQAVMDQRCTLCHGAQVQMKNVRLDSKEGVKLHAQAVYQQVVVTKAMPLNNATGITDAERNEILSALTYFSDPNDAIPDTIPVLGFLDDAIMIELVVEELKHEIDAYEDFCAFRATAAEEQGPVAAAGLDRDDWLEQRQNELLERMRGRRSRDSGYGGRGGFSLFSIR